MSKFPMIESIGLKILNVAIREKDLALSKFPYYHNLVDERVVLASDLEEILAEGKEMEIHREFMHGLVQGPKQFNESKYKGLLINIQPINKKVTKEEIIKFLRFSKDPKDHEFANRIEKHGVE